MINEWVNEQFQSGAGLNCAQIVALYFAEKYGLKKEDIIRMACGFGGGMRRGEVCGAVAGAIMVIGMKYGNRSVKELEAKYYCSGKTVEFEKEFEKRNGSIICKDLLKCNIGTEEGMQYAKDNNLFPTICPKMIVSAIEILEENGY
ncbi:C-GCAxxG-C-C family protein [Anaerosporobacter faecicola]|uniref:C-GCAxxG-C-C family protein n=1 Tax=Anaerosporobacter faecicola TaxID=2718714 RepID=UPI00143C3AA8|nr:C-GCAxxG-C-C family protein [Anaerosporobacter faecicola]